jgi:cell division protein FtsB
VSASSTLPGQARRGSRRATGARSRPPVPAVAGVRWDRIGRLALVLVLLALVYLYASAGLRLLSTWQQSRHDRAAVASLEREHARLQRQHEALSGPGALEAQARRLGMVRRGEQGFAISGLPGD